MNPSSAVMRCASHPGESAASSSRRRCETRGSGVLVNAREAHISALGLEGPRGGGDQLRLSVVIDPDLWPTFRGVGDAREGSGLPPGQSVQGSSSPSSRVALRSSRSSAATAGRPSTAAAASRAAARVFGARGRLSERAEAARELLRQLAVDHQREGRFGQRSPSPRTSARGVIHGGGSLLDECVDHPRC